MAPLAPAGSPGSPMPPAPSPEVWTQAGAPAAFPAATAPVFLSVSGWEAEAAALRVLPTVPPPAVPPAAPVGSVPSPRWTTGEMAEFEARHTAGPAEPLRAEGHGAVLVKPGVASALAIYPVARKLVLTVIAVLAVAALVGILALAVSGSRAVAVSDDAMSPELARGSLVLAKEAALENFDPGQLIVVPSDDGNGSLVRRVKALRSAPGGRWQVTVIADDPAAPLPAPYTGSAAAKPDYSIPWLGGVARFAGSPGGIVCASLLASLAVLLLWLDPVRLSETLQRRPRRVGL